MTYENSHNTNNDFDVLELISALWDRKILVTALTTFGAIISVLYALSLQNIYTSKALLAPTSADESLSTKLGNYSSLAGIAGIALPMDSNKKSTEAIERIKSYDFFINHFLPNIQLENLVAVKKWSQSSNTLIYNENMFNKAKNVWVIDTKNSLSVKPSNQEAYKTYQEILSIIKDNKTSFISLSIDHKSPYIAESWAKLIILNINKHMREIDKNIAESSISFLNKSTQKTNLSEIKAALSQLLENQLQTLMLTEATIDYVFKPITSPIAPEEKSKPTRSMICIIGTILSFMVSVLISLFLHFYNTRKV